VVGRAWPTTFSYATGGSTYRVRLTRLLTDGCQPRHIPGVVSLLGSGASMRCTKFHPKENIMKINIGSADRKLRAFVVAPVLVLAGLLVGPAGWLAIVLYVLAGVMLATSAVSFCPLYALLGLRTVPEQKVTPAPERSVSQ
jgi:hypothetical protein